MVGVNAEDTGAAEGDETKAKGGNKRPVTEVREQISRLFKKMQTT